VIGLDSNVLLRHLVQDDPGQARLASAVLGELTPDEPGFVSLVALAEVAWVLRQGYRLPKPVVLDHLENLLSARELEFEDAETVWTAVMQGRDGADFADALIADTAQLWGCEEVVTFDRRAAETLGMRLLS
jgi:predicted nucleic-acid-binding protein